MNSRVFFLFSGLAVLLALAGCGRSMMLQAERPAWRAQAEAQCMQTGAVKLGGAIVQAKPIEGPGMCGADFPLKVAALGESTRMSYSDVPRPPGGVGNGSQPNWPPTQARYTQPVSAAPPQGAQLRWAPGPPAIGAPEVTAPQGHVLHSNAPNYAAPGYAAPPSRPVSLYAPGVAIPDDIPDDAVLPRRGPAPQQRMQPAYNNAPVYVAPPQQPYQRQLPALGPIRGPQSTGAIQPATVTPAATLSCPIVSALDRWVSEGVQPAAMRWFGVQVTEIRQISAYSCRQMNGAGGRGISEHAFGNALDIAGFTLADGRKVVIKNSWRNGTPEEQGFLHDVQLFACDTFSTVLAPGYNAAHYDHIHVDLMRRKNGRRPCRPAAIPGEVVAAKARAVYAARRGTTYTGSIGDKAARPGQVLTAVPGADGLDDGEFDEDDVTGSIGAKAPAATGWPRLAPQTIERGRSPADF
ncbi:MAG: extensin family protein [Pseudolabrys sp.]|nr:extensin family protein [Pseudolabrys sp.]MDP2297246.1 extensin family protein [Pseudolabrys sp.]